MIDIVLATYNGERFLAEQLKSIQANHGYNKLISRLIVVDDGSSDKTLDIVRSFQQSDIKIELIINDSGLHSAKNNFAFGLTKSTAEFIMLSDQDDIWFPEKLEYLWAKVQKQKELSKPFLIFSDKHIVDEQLNVICDSYFKLKNIPKNWHESFSRLCQQNVVSGCTTLFNRALLDKALPIPQGAYMHDWWLALVAKGCGELVFIDKPLIKYRQHETNAIGAKSHSIFQLMSQFPVHYDHFKASFLAICEQASAYQEFEKTYKLHPNRTIYSLTTIKKQNLYHRIINFCHGRVTRSHFLGRVMLFVILLLIKVDK